MKKNNKNTINTAALTASTTLLTDNIKIDSNGRIVIGRNPLNPPLQGGQEARVEIVDITTITAFIKGGNAVWANVSQGEAQAACQTIGSGYHLIGENEWLTIAENILQVASNDADAVAVGMQLATTTPFSEGAQGDLS